jgi:hypothetical protein
MNQRYYGDLADWTPNDSAWLAGLLEGEGTFEADQVNGSSGRVAICMTDRDVVDRAARMMMAEVTTKLLNKYRPAFNRKPMYFARVSGTRARQVMERILPYLGERRAERVIRLLSIGTWGFTDSRGGLPSHRSKA